MQFPLTFWDISLWLAINSLVLLATAELVSSVYGQTTLLIDVKRLRTAALALCILFLLTMFIRVYVIVTTL